MSCDCDSHQSKLMDFDVAFGRLISEAKPITEAEKIDISSALDRVLAEDIIALFNVPPHNNSAMDGYAVRSSDLLSPGSLKLVGTTLAGQVYSDTLKSGECIRIMTGAPVPDSADAVVMQELTRAENETIHFEKAVKHGDNVRMAGEDIQEGTVVLSHGKLLSPTDIGLIASLGFQSVSVIRKIRVALMSTGDELVEPGNSLEAGQIFESNRYALNAMLKRLNVDVIDMGIIPDTAEATEMAFISADEKADIVVTSGGVSVGDADFVKPMLKKLGNIEFWKIAIKPGKPFAYGKLPNSYFIGLPGNPVSALVTFNQLAVPFMGVVSGAALKSASDIQAIADKSFKKKPGRLEFQRAIGFLDEAGQWHVKSTGAQGSGILSSMGKANGFVILPAESTGSDEGEQVTFRLFDHSIATL